MLPRLRAESEVRDVGECTPAGDPGDPADLCRTGEAEAVLCASLASPSLKNGVTGRNGSPLLCGPSEGDMKLALGLGLPAHRHWLEPKNACR